MEKTNVQGRIKVIIFNFLLKSNWLFILYKWQELK
jgi:hypothetical protein